MQLLSHLDSKQKAQIFRLVNAAQDFDQVSPFAEHVLLHLQHGGDRADQHLIVEKDDQIIGYAHIDATDKVLGPSVEVLVDPKHRSLGIAKSMLSKIIETFGDEIRLWSHGELPAAKKLAKKFGLEKVRTVIQMQANLDNLPALPENNYSVRTFLPGLDDSNWLSLNQKIFSNHPEQGRWGINDLKIRMQEEWFDASGFFLITKETQIIGFCWTKIHGHSHNHETEVLNAEQMHDHAEIGELYITGVDEKFEGQGLGKFLTILGMRHLAQSGLKAAVLYVDFENSRARKLYEKLGFLEVSRDVMYKKLAN